MASVRVGGLLERNLPEIALQRAVYEVSLMVRHLAERLEDMVKSMPQVPDEDSMHNLLKPYSVAVELRVAIEGVLRDGLWPAVEHLEKTAMDTEESLRQEFEEQMGKWGTPPGF